MTASWPIVVTTLCSVRSCGEVLTRDARVWHCPRGHAFDVARSGYVNLLQPGDRRSREAGDSRDAVLARARLDEAGVGDELRASLEERARALPLPPGAAVLDVGAGSGLALERLRTSVGAQAWALDLSTAAADRGARRWPELAWVVANADRRLPFADGSFALVVSSVGPKNPAEFRRVLAQGGALFLTVPAADDLIELRSAVQGRGERIARVARALEQFGGEFELVDRATLRTRRRFERAQIEDLLAATYRGARRRERERLGDLDALEVTVATELLLLEPR